MSAFSLVFNRNGTPIEQSVIRSMQRAFQDYGGALTVERPLPHLLVIHWHDDSRERPGHFESTSQGGFLVLDAVGKTAKPSSLDRRQSLIRDKPNYYDCSPPYVVISWLKDKLVLARDPLGRRALWFASVGHTIIAGSEPGLVLAHQNVTKEPDLNIVAERLASRPTTIHGSVYKAIRSVGADERITFSEYATTHEKLNSICVNTDSKKDTQQWASELTRTIEIAINSHFEKEITGGLAVSLSGGLDSSCLAGLVSNFKDKRKLALGTLRYPGLNCDESSYQNAVIKKSGIRSQNFNHRLVDPESDLFEYTKRSQTPVQRVDTGEMDLQRWCSAQNFTHLMIGTGGDELFEYLPYTFANNVAGGNFIKACRQLKRNGIAHELRSAVPYAPRKLRSFMRKYRIPEWITTDLAKRTRLWERLEKNTTLHNRVGGVSQRLDYLNNSAHLQIALEAFEYRSRECGINFVEPFKDLNLVRLMLSMPNEIRSMDGDPRAIQRFTFQQYLPEAVMNRRGKARFDEPLAQNFAQPWCRDLLRSSILVREGLVERTALMALHARIESQLKTNPSEVRGTLALWRIIGIEVWWRVNYS